MVANNKIYERYLTNEYMEKNPSWDIEDSPWKAAQVLKIVNAEGLCPASIVEVGCGAGGVIAEMRNSFPSAKLYGFDIAPAAMDYWKEFCDKQIEFVQGDFFQLNQHHYELMMVLDVIEHVSDPTDFLTNLQGTADYYVFHFPLDLSAISVLRESPLLYVRDKVGHIHYFTKGLALKLLAENGYEIMSWSYTGAAFTAPQISWKTRLAGVVRRVAYTINKDIGVRLLGGETLMVLAKSQRPV